MFHVRGDCADPCLVPMCGNHHLVVVKESLRTLVMGWVSAVCVSKKLVNTCFHGIGDIGRLALDYYQWEAVNEQDYIGDYGLINAFDFELIGTEECVYSPDCQSR